MDILDQLNTASSKTKKRPSIICNNQSLTNSTPLKTTPVGTQLQIQKQNIFVLRNDQHGSYQHLKNNHFDISKSSNQTLNILNSQKDSLSMSEQIKKFGAPQSLGVIFSESSEESQNSVLGTVSRRIRQNDKANSYKTELSPIEQEQLKEKLVASQLMNSQYALNVKQLQKESAEKQLRIGELQQKIEKLEKRNRQDRCQILEEQQQILKTQMQKINCSHAEEIKRIQQVLTWEFEHKSNSLQNQIESLNKINQRYQKLFQSQTELSKYKNMIDHNKQKENQQTETLKNSLANKQRQIKAEMQKLQRMKEEFYRQKLQNDRKLIQAQSELNEERLKIKKERIEMIRDQKEREHQIQEQIRAKINEYDGKLRKIQLERQQLQMIKTLVQKQKEQSKRLTEMAMSEYKKNMQSLMEEKQRMYAKQKQLIEKIQIVEAKNKNCNRTTLKIPQVQNEQSFLKSKIENTEILDEKQKSRCSLKKPEQNMIESPVNTNFMNQKYVPRFNNSANQAQRKPKGIYKLQQFYQ